MTTATHTQGLQAMYSPAQQTPFAYGQSYTGSPYPTVGQFPQASPWAVQGQNQHPQQFVQQQSGLSPILGQQLAFELFRIGQILQQAAMTGGQHGAYQHALYGQAGQYGQYGPFQTPIWS